MHCKKLLSVAIAGAMLMLAGCDKSVESYNVRLNIYPSLGMLKHAKVRVYAADGRTLLAKGSTGMTGSVGLSPGPVTGPLVIAIQGTDATTDGVTGFTSQGASYFDESLGTFVSLPAGNVMRAVVPTPYGSYGVTPLTELAYRIALDQNLFPLSSGEVNALNERVRSSLAPELDDITLPPAILFGATPPNSLEDTQANRYALRLAAMAMLGDGEARPIVTVMNALGSDILDGDADGLGVIDDIDKNGNNLTTPYDPVTMVDDINAHLAAFAASYAAPDLQAAVSSYNDILLTLDLANIDDGSNYTGCGPGDSILPDDIKGLSLNMHFERADAVSPYQNGDVMRFAFCTNGQLRLTDSYYVVADSFTTNVVDPIITTYSWTQLGNGLVYELVAMSNTLYEINVYGEYGSLYFGRFVE